MSKYPNSGTIGENDRKEKDSHPDQSGSCEITCPKCKQDAQYWISGWIKTGQRGDFLSLAFKPKDVQQQAQQARKAADDSDGPPPF